MEDKKEKVKPAKNYGWLAYILFFIPLLIDKTNPVYRHHANEGLEINIIDAIAVVLLLVGILVKPTGGLIALMLIFVLVGTGLLVLTTITKIYMIVTTLKGQQKSTPWMWNLRIIK